IRRCNSSSTNSACARPGGGCACSPSTAPPPTCRWSPNWKPSSAPTKGDRWPAWPPQRRTVLFDVHDGQILHPLLVPLCVDERGCVPLHLNHAPPGSLILFDRGYPAQWLFALLQQQGAHFVMRLPAGYNPDVNAFLQSGLRSEEHTSELQSRENLVCRLLLEKNNVWLS